MVRLFIAATLICLLPAFATDAWARDKKDWTGEVGISLAEHAKGTFDPATERISFFTQNKKDLNSSWSYVFSGQGWMDEAYFDDVRDDLRAQDTTDVRFQDVYLQYRNDAWEIRLGNQQVVWGETFGNFYADVVNPKDMRLGVPLDLARARLSTPMASIRYAHSSFSAQAIYLPQAQFNILPLPDSDFSPPLAANTGFKTVNIVREKQLPWGNSEAGGKLSQVIGTADLSVFYFDHYDRDPYYTASDESTFGKTLILNEQHSKVTSLGITLATDLNGYVLRAEAVQVKNRLIPIKVDNPTSIANSISTIQSNESSLVASLDLPTIRRLNLSVQYSQDSVDQQANYLARTSQTNRYVSIHATNSVGEFSNLELQVSYSLQDSSTRTQAEFMTPLNPKVEARFGLQSYDGTTDSEFGQTPRASQVYMLAKYFF